jgi:hypothetical protein
LAAGRFVSERLAWLPGHAALSDAAIELSAFRAGIDDAISKRDGGGAGFVPRSSPSWC